MADPILDQLNKKASDPVLEELNRDPVLAELNNFADSPEDDPGFGFDVPPSPETAKIFPTGPYLEDGTPNPHYRSPVNAVTDAIKFGWLEAFQNQDTSITPKTPESRPQISGTPLQGSGVGRQALGIAADTVLRGTDGAIQGVVNGLVESLVELGVLDPKDRLKARLKARFAADILDLYIAGAATTRAGVALTRNLRRDSRAARPNTPPTDTIPRPARVETPAGTVRVEATKKVTGTGRATVQNAPSVKQKLETPEDFLARRSASEKNIRDFETRRIDDPDADPLYEAARTRHAREFGEEYLGGGIIRPIKVTPRGKKLGVTYAPDLVAVREARLLLGDDVLTDSIASALRPRTRRGDVAIGTPEDLGVPAPGSGSNIRLDTRPLDAEARQVFRDTADQNPSLVKARTEVVSVTEAARGAHALGLNPEKIIDRYSVLRGLNAAPDAELIASFNDALHTLLREIRDGIKKGNAGVLTEAEQAAQIRNMETFFDVRNVVSGSVAEMGRAFNMLRKTSQDNVQRTLDDIRGIISDPQRNTGQFQEFFRAAEKFVDVAKPEDFGNALAKSSTRTKGQLVQDIAYEYFINALLSGPTTHIVNMVGNIGFNAWRAVEGLGVLAIPGSGLKAFDEIVGRAFAIRAASWDAMRHAFRAFNEEVLIDPLTKVDIPNPNALPSFTIFSGTGGKGITLFGERVAIPAPFKVPQFVGLKVGGNIVRIPTRFLGAADQLMKSFIVRTELNAAAFRAAREAGFSPIADRKAFGEFIHRYLKDVPDDVMAAAVKQSRKGTFTEPLGPIMSKGLAFLNSVPMMRLVTPFVRTPFNISRESLARTPLRALHTQGNMFRNLLGKDPLARRAEAVRLGMAGIAGTFMWELADQEICTGNFPADAKERRRWIRDNIQPLSCNLEKLGGMLGVNLGKGYISYARFEPLATIMGIFADSNKVVKGIMSDDEKFDLFSSGLALVSNNVVNKVFLQGLTSFGGMVNPNTGAFEGQEFLKNIAGGFVPNIINQIQKSNDPILRDLRTSSDGLEAVMGSIINEVRARMGAVENFHPRRDVFGQVRRRQGSPFNPFNITERVTDPIRQELDRIDVDIKMPRRKISLVEQVTVTRDGEGREVKFLVKGIELTPSEYTFYQVWARVPMVDRLKKLFQSPAYISAPPLAKKRAVERIIRRSDRAAKDRLRPIVLERLAREQPEKLRRLREEFRRSITPERR